MTDNAHHACRRALLQIDSHRPCCRNHTAKPMQKLGPSWGVEATLAQKSCCRSHGAKSAYADKALQKRCCRNHAAGTMVPELCHTTCVVEIMLQKAGCRCGSPGSRWETGCRRLGEAREGNRCSSVTGLLLDDMPICASPSSYSPLPNRWCPYLRWISSSSRVSGSACTLTEDSVTEDF